MKGLVCLFEMCRLYLAQTGEPLRRQDHVGLLEGSPGSIMRKGLEAGGMVLMVLSSPSSFPIPTSLGKGALYTVS